jgi:drug/metabolite transporter (DMT)-like permease
VLPIVATTPVVTIPFTYWIDGDRPSVRSLIGGIIAVMGTVALAIVANP